MNYMQKMWVKVYYEALRAEAAHKSIATIYDMRRAKEIADMVICSLTKLNGIDHDKQQ